MGPLMAFMPLYMWEMWDVTPVTDTRTVESRAVFSLSQSSYLSQPHNRRWCTLFRPMYFLTWRTQYFCPLWPILGILSQIYALLVYFFQAYIMWSCTEIDKYEVCTLLAQARHNRWQRHPQVKRVQSQDANLPAAVGRAAMRAAHVSLPTHWCLSLLSRPKPSYLSSKYRQMCTSQTQSHRQEHTHASPNTNTHKHRFRSYIVSEQNVINDFVLIFLFFLYV